MLCDVRQLAKTKLCFSVKNHNSRLWTRSGLYAESHKGTHVFNLNVSFHDRNLLINTPNQINYLKYRKHPYKTGAESGNGLTSQRPRGTWLLSKTDVSS